jgi:hypothetical protein
MPSQYANIKTV